MKFKKEDRVMIIKHKWLGKIIDICEKGSKVITVQVDDPFNYALKHMGISQNQLQAEINKYAEQGKKIAIGVYAYESELKIIEPDWEDIWGSSS